MLRFRQTRPSGLNLAAIPALVALAATVALAGGPSMATPSTSTIAESPVAEVSPALTRETFAKPPAAVRPMYRWWMPLAFTDDDELRRELRDIAAAGGGGVEVAPFVVPGAGHQDNAFLAQYGWGTPLWAHKLEVITEEAADLGLVVDQNLGPQYPATVPSLNSFNQPEAEQQLIYGREFDQPGTSRTGALPSPTTAPPSVTTQLCAPASAGDAVLKVKSLGGFAAGDTITVGTGATAEKVTVQGLGDRTSTCADLTVTATAQPHATGASVVNVARTTRLRTLVAQCAGTCGPGTSGPIQLVPSSVQDVTSQVTESRLDFTFPAGNGNPWVVADFLQTASGLIAQRGGYTATQPNYVVDHWDRGGVEIQTEFWDESILTDAVRANLARIGRGAVFEDSLELGNAQKWTGDLLGEFRARRGYDLSTMLPAIAGTGVQGRGTPAFELAGVGPQVREDYRKTLSDLYVDEYVAPMQSWAGGHGLDFRVQSYGTPIDSGAAAAVAGIPEGESLNFGSLNPLGSEQDYRVLSGGAHAVGKDLVSVECCAIFQGNHRSSVSGPDVPGGFGEGGDGTGVGGRYSQGLLGSIYRAYAGGVNQLVWHGYPYRDAPAGVGTSGRDGSWPGYHPWDIFGVINVNDEFGPRQPSWPDYQLVNEALARTQLVLRQGHSSVDLAVYHDELGLAGRSVGEQRGHTMLGNDSATSAAGYTYEYVAPELLAKDALNAKALVLNNQTSISLGGADRLLGLAKRGVRIFVVGDLPSRTAGAEPGERLPEVVEALLRQGTVTRVPGEAELPGALAARGIQPAVSPESPTSALGLVRREGSGISYDFVYNRSARTVEQRLTLTGSGRPYRLNTWTGEIEPIAEYTSDGRHVTVPVRIAPYDNVVIALAGNRSALAPTPGVHAVDSTGDVHSTAGDTFALRATANGAYVTTLSNGKRVVTQVGGLAAPRALTDWTLRAQTWTPGANQFTSLKTDQPEIALTAGPDGLPSWREITSPVDLGKASGLGSYRASLTLPATWSPNDGAYLDLGKVLDTVSLTVNGTEIMVDQGDRGRIDLGRTLRPGANAITVRVATTMFNAVRASGDSNYQLPDWQRAGLMGPVVLTPYRDLPIR